MLVLFAHIQLFRILWILCSPHLLVSPTLSNRVFLYPLSLERRFRFGILVLLSGGWGRGYGMVAWSDLDF